MPSGSATIGPAGLGLPPVVDHRHAEPLLGPAHRVRVGALAGEEQAAQAGEIVARDQPAVRVLLLDGAQRRRRGEQRGHPVLGDHAPEGAGVGRADRLALVEHGGAAVDERRVDDVGVADHPADVGGRPEHLARLNAVDVGHRPFERDHVAAVVADDALGLAGRAGGVEDVERVGGGDGDARLLAAGGPCPRHLGGVVAVAGGVEFGAVLFALDDDHGGRPVRRLVDRRGGQRHVGNRCGSARCRTRR